MPRNLFGALVPLLQHQFVYGTFAALPLFLMGLYLLWALVLAGALFVRTPWPQTAAEPIVRRLPAADALSCGTADAARCASRRWVGSTMRPWTPPSNSGPPSAGTGVRRTQGHPALAVRVNARRGLGAGPKPGAGDTVGPLPGDCRMGSMTPWSATIRWRFACRRFPPTSASNWALAWITC